MPSLAPRRSPFGRAPAASLALLAASLLADGGARAAGWQEPLQAEIQRIDDAAPGTLGVYVKDLATGETFSHGAERFWYLGSTAKVPIAIATLQQVDAGRLRLDARVTLTEADRIEAGKLVWERPGTVYTVEQLVSRMLLDSDNTAANMLIRTIGLETVNASAREAMGGAAGFKGLTDFASIRREVYVEIHPDAARLSNDQMVRIAAAPLGPGRVEAVRRALGVPASQLRAKTIDEAYERYYAAGRNQATLAAYGRLLEKLVRGELLSPASQARLFEAMKLGIFTNYRMQAGLPRSVTFIHKTGTQYLTACHAGVVTPEGGGVRGIVAVTCTAGLDEQHEAGKVHEQVGKAIAGTVLASRGVAR